MPVYEYKGITAGNRVTRGLVDADSPRGARLKLRSEGIFPTEIVHGRTRSETSEALARLKLPQLRRVPDLDLAIFTRQLGTMTGAGVPLIDSLSAFATAISISPSPSKSAWQMPHANSPPVLYRAVLVNRPVPSLMNVATTVLA